MYRLYLMLLLLGSSLNLIAHNDGPSIDIHEFTEQMLQSSYNSWPKIFQNEEYKAYFRYEVEVVLKTINPDIMVSLKAGKKIDHVPLQQCILISLMNPKTLHNQSFEFMFTNWRNTIERQKKGEIRDNDFVFIPVEKKS